MGTNPDVFAVATDPVAAQRFLGALPARSQLQQRFDGRVLRRMRRDAAGDLCRRSLAGVQAREFGLSNRDVDLPTTTDANDRQLDAMAAVPLHFAAAGRADGRANAAPCIFRAAAGGEFHGAVQSGLSGTELEQRRLRAGDQPDRFRQTAITSLTTIRSTARRWISISHRCHCRWRRGCSAWGSARWGWRGGDKSSGRRDNAVISGRIPAHL